MNGYLPVKDGIWPVMLTPFTEDGRVDYSGLEKLVKWYMENTVDGLFAVCQSSEMFYLDLEERIEIARFVKEKAGQDFPVIASGHISDDIEEQIDEIGKISETGIDAFVMVTNRLAAKDESDDVFIKNVLKILDAVKNIPFGLYECPYPYKRLMTPEVLRWCADTGRFMFLKDTCCDLDQLKAKCEAVSGTPLKIFNANSATFLDSLALGVSGFSGVMANFHPGFYSAIMMKRKYSFEKARILNDFTGFASLAEKLPYPACAKYYLGLEGVDIGIYCRCMDHRILKKDQMMQMEQLYRLNQMIADNFF